MAQKILTTLHLTAVYPSLTDTAHIEIPTIRNAISAPSPRDLSAGSMPSVGSRVAGMLDDLVNIEINSHAHLIEHVL